MLDGKVPSQEGEGNGEAEKPLTYEVTIDINKPPAGGDKKGDPGDN